MRMKNEEIVKGTCEDGKALFFGSQIWRDVESFDQKIRACMIELEGFSRYGVSS